VRIEVGSATDIGRVRERNEDSILVEPPLYVVADGMGGHRGGQVASQLALETLEQLSGDGSGSLAEHVRRANRAVWDRALEDERLSGMGTTLTAARIDGSSALIAHVGDSRAYLLRDGMLRQLTTDHTLVARMVSSGEITEAEAENHPHKNVLTRAIGTDEQVEVDEDTVDLQADDHLLLCSDGLTGMVTEDQIQAILEHSDGAQQAADRLVKAANRAGGIDNISVVVLDAIGEGDEAAARPHGPSRGGASAPASPS
jgi:PPM family protein phosphatase